MRTKIENGQRYGRGVVVGRTSRNGNPYYWKLVCDCGNTYTAYSGNLLKGYKRSCGCIRTEAATLRIKSLHEANCLPDGEAGLRNLYAIYAGAARRRGLAFSLSLDEFKRLTSSACFYCGEPPAQTTRQVRVKSRYLYNGIDRQDNNDGYVNGNCVPACGVCNYMKHDFAVEEFIARCILIAQRHNRKRSAEMTDPVVPQTVTN